MASDKTMNTNTTFLYDWGETLRVVTTAPESFRLGQICSVCGMREHGGENLYLIEFSDGSSLEVPECYLEPVPDE